MARQLYRAESRDVALRTKHSVGTLCRLGAHATVGADAVSMTPQTP